MTDFVIIYWQVASERIDVSYILVVYEAEEFCNLVVNESLIDHVRSVQHHYPHQTICYVTNKLMAYINKRFVKLLSTIKNALTQFFLDGHVFVNHQHISIFIYITSIEFITFVCLFYYLLPLGQSPTPKNKKEKRKTPAGLLVYAFCSIEPPTDHIILNSIHVLNCFFNDSFFML